MLNVTKPCRIAGTGMHVPSVVDSHTLEAQNWAPKGGPPQTQRCEDTPLDQRPNRG